MWRGRLPGRAVLRDRPGPGLPLRAVALSAIQRTARVVLVVATSLIACRGTTHTGAGEIVEIADDALHVTIAHEDVPGLMPAMTMRFRVRSPDVLAAATPGLRVRFDLAQEGQDLIVTRIVPDRSGRRSRPGLHDHTPHHGGVVSMVGLRHLEAVAAVDGDVRVYLTDAWRRPLGVEGWTGRATLDLPGGPRTVTLRPHGDRLEGRDAPLAAGSVRAHVRVVHGDEEPLEMHAMLPLGAAGAGAASMPAAGCEPPPARAGAAGRRPRCVLAFPQPVTAVGITPDARTLLVAVVDGGLTAWSLADATFLRGFEPPPPTTAAAAQGGVHPQVIDALAVAPDGRQVVAAHEGRLLRYAVASGRLLRVLPAPAGVVQSIAWSPDGDLLLVAAAYDPAVHLVRATDGQEIRRLAVAREGTAVAFSPDGGLAAVASETGRVVLHALDGDAAPRLVGDVGRPLHTVAFAGDRLASVGAAGVLYVWETADATRVVRSRPGSPGHRLVGAPDGTVAAVAAYDGSIRLHALRSGGVIETLRWHQAIVHGLAWGGPTLVSGDAAGRLAIWDVGAGPAGNP